jgi:hypothetical protein
MNPAANEIPPLFTPDFLIIPYQLFTDKKLQPADALIYGVVYWFEHMKDGKCIASNRTIGEYLHFHPNSVARSLGNLERSGYINIVYEDASKKVRLCITTKVSFKKLQALTPELKGFNPQVKGGLTVRLTDKEYGLVIENSREREIPLPLVASKYSSIKSLEKDILETISKDYGVPLKFVEDCKENMELYCGAKGRSYKDYNMALRNWVKKDRAKRMYDYANLSKKRGGVYDARS